ncbi:uncharacterized protein LOC110747658 isoform X1 [Prunus avium]|uniref:Uncharacterized protein LOC110747658 isoform X1 n=1 Tax=Prunus avium TaxID=42229 RepID=A0A6P5RNR4_PRUAV|nr:uncharacterized protein LOC110747658 isoform X1 [Prunus avium]
MALPMEIGVAIAVFLMAVAMESDGRELRPSDHGLLSQGSPPPSAKSPTEVKSFFVGGGGGGGGGGENSPTALPKAMNSSDPSWWNGVVSRGGGHRDHVRDVLLLASLVCGITGVALFVASAVVYLLRNRKHKSLPSSASS